MSISIYHYLSLLQFSETPLLYQQYVTPSDAGKILRTYLALSFLPHTEIWREVTNIKVRIGGLANRAVRMAMKHFHSQYFIPFWMFKIGPHRVSVYGFPHKTNNYLEALHPQMGSHLKKHLVFINFMIGLIKLCLEPMRITLQPMRDSRDVSAKRKKVDMAREM
ncbi:MAG: hypothetical protein Q8O19_05390, partial [Rectinemataceae bacterium]|nr:hypothetical protein [Rectinemataceae bacterium]